MENYQKLGLKNLFEPSKGSGTINFRNDTCARDSVSSIETKADNGTFVVFPIKTEDNIAMALALLGVGRVTDKLEERAQRRADCIGGGLNPATTDDLLDTVVVNLRAILIAKQREEEAASKDIEDAYFLYLLAYPKGTGRVEFESTGLKDHWVSVLRKVRKDPTVLGSL